MTPFGQAVRRLRAERGVSQRQMAASLGVSPAYLSALEHGRRGRPGWQFTQRVIGYFNIIWDEAEELERLAELSDPRAVIDTSELGLEGRLFIDRLSTEIGDLDAAAIAALDAALERETARLAGRRSDNVRKR